MLGQTKFEFIFGIVLFAVVIIFIVTQMNNIFSRMITDYDTDVLKARTLNMVKYLAEMGDIEKVYISPVPVDVMFVNDISGSMDGTVSPWGTNCKIQCNTFGSGVCACSSGCPYCYDCDGNGYNADPQETPCSINDAKEAVGVFLDNLDPSEDKAGIAAFNVSTYLLQLTSNLNQVRTYANMMQGKGGTAIGEGINRANNEFLARGRSGIRWVQILITDGVNNSGMPVETATQAALANGIGIYVIGLGETSNFDEDLLKYIASTTGGKYYNAPSSSQLVDIYEEIANEIKSETVSFGIVVDKSYEITREKIDELNSDCSKLEMFELGNYRLDVYNATHKVVHCGIDSLRPPLVVTQKYVYVDGSIGNITIEVW